MRYAVLALLSVIDAFAVSDSPNSGAASDSKVARLEANIRTLTRDLEGIEPRRKIDEAAGVGQPTRLLTRMISPQGTPGNNLYAGGKGPAGGMNSFVDVLPANNRLSSVIQSLRSGVISRARDDQMRLGEDEGRQTREGGRSPSGKSLG